MSIKHKLKDNLDNASMVIGILFFTLTVISFYTPLFYQVEKNKVYILFLYLAIVLLGMFKNKDNDKVIEDKYSLKYNIKLSISSCGSMFLMLIAISFYTPIFYIVENNKMTVLFFFVVGPVLRYFFLPSIQSISISKVISIVSTMLFGLLGFIISKILNKNLKR